VKKANVFLPYNQYEHGSQLILIYQWDRPLPAVDICHRPGVFRLPLHSYCTISAAENHFVRILVGDGGAHTWTTCARSQSDTIAKMLCGRPWNLFLIEQWILISASLTNDDLVRDNQDDACDCVAKLTILSILYWLLSCQNGLHSHWVVNTFVLSVLYYLCSLSGIIVNILVYFLLMCDQLSDLSCLSHAFTKSCTGP